MFSAWVLTGSTLHPEASFKEAHHSQGDANTGQGEINHKEKEFGEEKKVTRDKAATDKRTPKGKQQTAFFPPGLCN